MHCDGEIVDGGTRAVYEALDVLASDALAPHALAPHVVGLAPHVDRVRKSDTRNAPQ